MMMMSFLMKIVEIIADEADKELYSPAAIKNQLMKLEQLLKEGEMTEDEYDIKENELLDLLEKHLEEQNS